MCVSVALSQQPPFSRSKTSAAAFRNAVAGQGHGVVAWACDLLRTVGVRPEARRGVIARTAGIGYVARHGHDRHVEQVADARTRKVGVRKADHRGVAFMVSRAPVPVLGDARGPDLHEAERDIRADEDMSVAAGSDLGVDPAGQILRPRLRGRARREGDKRRCSKKVLKSFHGFIERF